jgi:serine/threonine protein kinase
MSNVSSVKILDTIEKSGLLAADVLQAALVEFEEACARTTPISQVEDDGSRLFLEHLVRTNRLTTWQAGKLNDGRHKGFFLGSYRLLSRLGAGGMSTVYLAEHIHMRQRRAIKVLPRHRVGDSSYLDRFYREARAAAALDHTNVVHAYDVGCDGDIHFLVMEFVEGSDLQKLVARRGVLSYESVADVIRQTAEGLAHAHKAGVIHRDIKPANLLIDNTGVVKILDMGLARYTAEESEKQASLTQMHDENVIGTTNYLAPEQALNSHKADARSDIYSLGCTMYYALTGLPPFNTGTVAERLMAHIHTKPEPVTKHRPRTPDSLMAICDKMLEKKPSDRYQSAEEIVAVLKAWRKQWLADGGDKSGSGVQIGVPYVAEEDDGDLEPAGVGSMRDTDAVRAQATSLGKRSFDDDELRLADDDDAHPKSKGSARSAKSSSSRSGSGSRKTAPLTVSAAALASGSSKSGGIKAVTAPAAPPRNDFLDEILSAAAQPASPSAPSSLSGSYGGYTPALRPQAAPGRSAANKRSAPDDSGDVKSDVENLFRKHPLFGLGVFLFFSVLLVFGLYYMINRSSSEPAPPTTATSRDQ